MRAKKSYGQHFLNNENYAQRIANALQLTDQYEYVLEVGPGQGMLTKYLLERKEDFSLKVVEADRDMVDHLHGHFPDLEGSIIAQDFMKLWVQKHIEGPFGLIGNYPYNISSQILMRTIEWRSIVPEMVGMFQKEVADRVLAGPGSKTYGTIGVMAQAFYETSMLFKVGPGNFNPPPKVQSAVIRLVRREDPLVEDAHFKAFRRVVKAAFNQRRKMLRNSLKSVFPGEILQQEEIFTLRPEQISVEDFAGLGKRLAETFS
ncbi:MAG: 16S rRNA (adenine(1518)-N(6)/adenine(1519)-N(6))-dimethyltransferase RsmA [Bacteroidota bacterium]